MGKNPFPFLSYLLQLDLPLIRNHYLDKNCKCLNRVLVCSEMKSWGRAQWSSGWDSPSNARDGGSITGQETRSHVLQGAAKDLKKRKRKTLDHGAEQTLIPSGSSPALREVWFSRDVSHSLSLFPVCSSRPFPPTKFLLLLLFLSILMT